MGDFLQKIRIWRLHCCTYAIKTLYVQLFMTIISFPILVWWGIPISTYSLISTTLFTPFLLCFLFLSSLFFFCHLFYIPTYFIALCLEAVSSFWISVITCKSGPLLIGFCKPPIILLITLIAATLFIAQKQTLLIHQKTIFLTCFLAITLLSCKTVFAPKNGSFIIPCHTKTVEIINHNGVVLLVDPGVIGSRPSASSWISYEFVSELIKTTGRTSLDHMVICRINQRTCEALLALLQKITIKHLYIPAWSGHVPYGMYKLWKQIVAICEKNEATIHYINEKETTAIETIISIHAQSRITHYHDAIYHQLYVTKSLIS